MKLNKEYRLEPDVKSTVYYFIHGLNSNKTSNSGCEKVMPLLPGSAHSQEKPESFHAIYCERHRPKRSLGYDLNAKYVSENRPKYPHPG